MVLRSLDGVRFALGCANGALGLAGDEARRFGGRNLGVFAFDWLVGGPRRPGDFAFDWLVGGPRRPGVFAFNRLVGGPRRFGVFEFDRLVDASRRIHDPRDDLPR